MERALVLRLHVYGKYCTYFRADQHDLTVIRIIHGAHDVDGIIFDTEFGETSADGDYPSNSLERT